MKFVFTVEAVDMGMALVRLNDMLNHASKTGEIYPAYVFDKLKLAGVGKEYAGQIVPVITVEEKNNA